MAGLAVVAALLTGCATESGHEDRITSFDVEADLSESGTLTVTESITYDFGVEPSAGLDRDIRTVAGDGRLTRRELLVDVVSVASPTGAPSEIEEMSESHGLLRLGIGDSANQVRGEQTYVLTYTVEGSVTAEDGYDELYWNFVGTEWDVPIDDTEVVLTAPVIEDVTCVAGEEGESERDCDVVAADADSVTMTESGLRVGQGITARVALPSGTVEVTEPSYRLPPFPAWLTWSGVLSILAVLVFVPLWAWTLSTVGDRLTRIGRPIEATAVSPAAAGFLSANEKIRPEHLSAMLVDLEERGVLTSHPHPENPNDWMFESVSGHHVPLSRAEELFAAALFRNVVADLASIRGTLTASQIQQIREALARELRHGGYIHGNVVSYIGLALVAVLFIGAVVPLPLIGELIPVEVPSMHAVALGIAHFTVCMSLVVLTPIGATRTGRKVKVALKELANAPGAPPAYLVASGHSDLVAAFAPDPRFASDPEFHRRWNSTLQRRTKSANPSSNSGESGRAGGGTSVGGGGGGGGGRR